MQTHGSISLYSVVIMTLHNCWLLFNQLTSLQLFLVRLGNSKKTL